MSHHLRKDSWIPHIGYESEELRGGRLPLTREVLSYFFYIHRHEKKSIRESARMVVRATVEKFWSKTTIPISQEIRSIERIERLYQEFQALSKNAKKKDKQERKH